MDERARRIVKTAVEFAEKGGFEAVRLRDVASKAGVALGTLYRHFRSKEDLLMAGLSLEAEALSQMARMLSLTERLEEGRAWLARAEEVASPDHPLGWTRYLGVRGIFERESGDRDRALSTFEEMYAYALEHDVPRRDLLE